MKSQGSDTKSKNEEDKQNKLKRKQQMLLIKRTIVAGIAILCALSAYFSRQYALVGLSIGFGLVVLFLIE